MISKINFQRPTKADGGDGHSLLVHSLFFTIQGEGPHTGKPAVFLRLGGCNLQCPGCDTEYTNGAVNEHIASILTRIGMAFGPYPGEKLVVITGGEPFRQNIAPLIDALYDEGYFIQVETNGTLGYHPTRRFMASRFGIVVSPKAGKVHPTLLRHIIAYKYVLDVVHIDPRDGLPTSVLGLPAAPARPHEGFKGDVYVQPADEPQDSYAANFNLGACVEVAKRFGHRVAIQAHKIMMVD